MPLALQVEELVKRYGDVVAVDHLSFSVKRGEIFGLLGPNGAGKTTTLEIVEGLQQPDSGRVTVLGLDSATRSREIKDRTGVQLQASSYYEYLTLREILSLLGSFYARRLPPVELLELVGLADKARRRIRQLSGGEQQRFALAASLVNDPELVILDEPTTGLDPVSRRDLWALVRQVRDRGATVIVTTHYMEEAEEHCDRLAIINHGRLLASGAPRDLINRIEASYAVRLVTAGPLTGEQLEALGRRVEAAPIVNENTCLLRLHNDPTGLQNLLDEVGRTGVVLEQLEITPVTLEDVFIELTRT
ncbi:MAG: ABC transporter ATP-binding protein [Chloroflexi bacterium]|nr:ABC transporter ATP-binding protein [Chloroflexota bacterium]MYE40325.1 ABC transporter ATP-binding protein [Chloroflexota bacterium]